MANKSLKIDFKSNSPEVLKMWDNAKKTALYSMGLKWQEVCTQIITNNGIVDTGRLRGSLTFITEDRQGGSISRVAENKSDDFIKGSGEKDAVIVGSNVKYATKQEMGNKKGGFLRPSVTDYREDYKNIVKNAMLNTNL